MTKIWYETWDSKDHTKAQILNMETHLDTYMDVMASVPMTGRFPDTTVKILTGRQPTDYINSGGMFIVSDRLRGVMEEFPIRCEFFLLNILHKGKPYTKSQYYFCNILDKFPFFDYNKGKYTFWTKPGYTDRIEKVAKLAIDEGKASKYAIFRMAKCSPEIVCVSESLADRIIEKKFTGMRFVTADDWTFC